MFCSFHCLIQSYPPSSCPASAWSTWADYQRCPFFTHSLSAWQQTSSRLVQAHLLPSSCNFPIHSLAPSPPSLCLPLLPASSTCMDHWIINCGHVSLNLFHQGCKLLLLRLIVWFELILHHLLESVICSLFGFLSTSSCLPPPLPHSHALDPRIIWFNLFIIINFILTSSPTSSALAPTAKDSCPWDINPWDSYPNETLV